MFRMKEESSGLSSLKEEFAQRIADAEKKLQVACKERDAAKKVRGFLVKLMFVILEQKFLDVN